MEYLDKVFKQSYIKTTTSKMGVAMADFLWPMAQVDRHFRHIYGLFSLILKI